MGTDIHFYVERKRAASGTGQQFAWEVVPPPPRDFALYPITTDEPPEDPRQWWGPGLCMRAYPCDGPNDDGCFGDMCPTCAGHKRNLWWYRNRNYSLFAILAGMRNEYQATPIAEPRGLPINASRTVTDHHSWDHSASWLLLSEVLAYPWDASIFHRVGLLPLKDPEHGIPSYVQWRADRSPPQTWIDASYPNRDVTVVEPDEAERLLAIKGPSLRKHSRTEVRIKWETLAIDDCKDFLTMIDQFVEPMLGAEYLELKRVWQDAIEGGPGLGPVAVIKYRDHVAELRAEMLARASEIRFVFGFDS